MITARPAPRIGLPPRRQPSAAAPHGTRLVATNENHYHLQNRLSVSLPMHGAAVLLGLAAAGCLYAAAPNQLLLPPAVDGASPVSRRGARWLSVMAVLLAA
ncbi:hypothetical protein, partial [Ralstonia pseudosolanacearum]|uniref:hypothetical protein n=2 Tax=Ralstonia pseudosolanacearum TaxID=1310165 RepID=UPI003221C5CA